MPKPNVLTISEAAEEKGCSRQAIYNAIARGQLTRVQLGKITVISRDKRYDAYQVPETGGRLHRHYIEKHNPES